MAEAPFLTGIRRGTLVGDPDEPDAPDAGAPQGESEFEADEFPAWYQDRLTDEAEATDDAVVEPEPDPLAWLEALPAVRTLDALEFGAVTVLAGDNGTGKSTLVEAIAVAAGFNPEGGSKNVNFRTWDTHSPLADELVLEWRRRPRWGWFLRAETFYNLASYIAADADIQQVFPHLHDMSHGESFLALADIRFRGEGLYIFDEPESALSVQGQRRLVDIMRRSLAKGSQFIVSTHSPLLMAFPDATVFEVDTDEGLRRTTFDDLASTRAWRGFWHDPADWFRM